jgi:NADH-quinone oxidoreductase subunit C
LSSAEGGGATTEEAPVEDAVEVDETREGLVASMRSALGDAVVGTHVAPGRETWVRVGLSAWQEAGLVARDQLGCAFFDFLSAIDWLPSPFGRDMDSQEDLIVHGGPDRQADEMATGVAGGDARFQLLARVHNPAAGYGLVLKADLGDDLKADSWVPVYAGADWHEREAWEMFGITFVGHPHLRHLYLRSPSASSGPTWPLRPPTPGSTSSSRPGA